jgi:hypothetical protein
LCPVKILAEPFKQDDVVHIIIPVSGLADLNKQKMSQSHMEVCLLSSEVHQLAEYSKATHTHSIKYGCYTWPFIWELVWWIQPEAHRAHHRLKSEPYQHVCWILRLYSQYIGSEGLRPQLVHCAPFLSIAPYFRILYLSYPKIQMAIVVYPKVQTTIVWYLGVETSIVFLSEDKE